MSLTVEIEPGLTLADTVVRPSGSQDCPVPSASDIGYWDLVLHSLNPNWRWGFDVGRVSGKCEIYAEHIGTRHISLDPEALARNTFSQIGSSQDATYHADLSDSISVGTTVSWSESVTLGVSFTVGVEVGAGPAKASASTSYSLSATVGHDQSHTRTLDVGSQSGVSIDVPAGKAVLAFLLLERGTLAVDIAYRRRLDGELVWRTAAGVGPYAHYGPWQTTEGSVLAPHMDRFSTLSTFSTDFFGVANDKVVDIPDTSNATVEATIDRVLHNPRTTRC